MSLSPRIFDDHYSDLPPLLAVDALLAPKLTGSAPDDANAYKLAILDNTSSVATPKLSAYIPRLYPSATLDPQSLSTLLLASFSWGVQDTQTAQPKEERDPLKDVQTTIDQLEQIDAWVVDGAANIVKDVLVLGGIAGFLGGIHKQSTQFVGGFLKGTADFLSSICTFILHPEEVAAALKTIATHLDDPALYQQLLQALIEPYQKSLEEGKPAEAVGRAFSEFITTLATAEIGKGAGKTIEATQLIRIVRMLRTAGIGDDVIEQLWKAGLKFEDMEKLAKAGFADALKSPEIQVLAKQGITGEKLAALFKFTNGDVALTKRLVEAIPNIEKLEIFLGNLTPDARKIISEVYQLEKIGKVEGLAEWLKMTSTVDARVATSQVNELKVAQSLVKEVSADEKLVIVVGQDSMTDTPSFDIFVKNKRTQEILRSIEVHTSEVNVVKGVDDIRAGVKHAAQKISGAPANSTKEGADVVNFVADKLITLNKNLSIQFDKSANYVKIAANGNTIEKGSLHNDLLEVLNTAKGRPANAENLDSFFVYNQDGSVILHVTKDPVTGIWR